MCIATGQHCPFSRQCFTTFAAHQVDGVEAHAKLANEVQVSALLHLLQEGCSEGGSGEGHTQLLVKTDRKGPWGTISIVANACAVCRRLQQRPARAGGWLGIAGVAALGMQQPSQGSRRSALHSSPSHAVPVSQPGVVTGWHMGHKPVGTRYARCSPLVPDLALVPRLFTSSSLVTRSHGFANQKPEHSRLNKMLTTSTRLGDGAQVVDQLVLGHAHASVPQRNHLPVLVDGQPDLQLGVLALACQV